MDLNSLQPITFNSSSTDPNDPHYGWRLVVSGITPPPPPPPGATAAQTVGGDGTLPWPGCDVNPAACGSYQVLGAANGVIGSGLIGVLAEPVPEPATLGLLGLGLAGVGFVRRKRKR